MEKNNKNISNPEEVLKYLESHNTKANAMIDESHEIVNQIKKMNEEISSEIKTQNVIINTLERNVDKGQKLSEKGMSKLDETLKNTSTFSLIIAMIVQVVFLIFLIFL